MLLFLCCHAAQESQSEFHCVYLAQQVPALQPGGGIALALQAPETEEEAFAN